MYGLEDYARRRRVMGQRRRVTAWPAAFSPDHGLAMRMASRLDFGCVWINTHIPIVAEMARGGFKRSGYGKDLSMYGLEDYTRIKHDMLNEKGCPDEDLAHRCRWCRSGICGHCCSA